MKYKKNHLFLALVLYALLLVSYQSAAQSGSGQQQEYLLTGTVTDSYGPLPGVHVLIKGTKTGTFTDKEGSFSLNVQASSTLVFSYLGYKTLEVSILGRTTLEVELLAETTQLQEVEVNAGYYTVKERERTGSISRVTAEEIELQPVSNPLAALQGRMAGVDIVQNSGVPGGGFTVQIRGQNSIASGNNPLYIVDGVPFNSESMGSLSANVIPLSNISPLNAIDPQSIESIEVLKDADATAIYGSRGANGVVLITTKKGVTGKLRTTVSMTATTGRVTILPDLLDTQEYLTMRQMAFANDGANSYPANAHDVNGNWDQSRYTNWPKVLLGGTSFRQNARLVLSGGSGTSRFMVAGNHQNETTVFPGNSKYKKSAVHTNYNYKSADELFKMNLSVDYVVENNALPATDFTRLAWSLAPNAPALYNSEGDLNWENSTWTNPLASLNADYGYSTKNLITNLQLSYKVLPNLELRANLGYNDMDISEFRTNPSTIYDPVYEADSQFSSIRTNTGERKSWIAEPQVNWKNTLGKFQMDILAGASFQERDENIYTVLASNFPSNDLIFDHSAASNITILEDDQLKYKYHAVFGRVNLKWDSKLFLNLTGRRDGSSRFGPGRQFANFGAVGMAWNFSDIVQKLWPTLNFGKLRGSFGITGNDQIGDYQYLDTYLTSGISYGGSGLRPSRLFNPIFGWEENKKLEVGLELGLWSDRLFISGSWYRNRSGNQLVGIPQPGTTGFRTLTANLGAIVQNTGAELHLRTINIKGGNWHWNTSLNVSIPKNTLLEFPDLESSTYANSYIIGKPLGIQKLYHYKGIDPETGTYTFEDYNGDGTIGSPDDRQWIEDLSPRFFGGLSNTIHIGKWELDFLFQFKKQKSYGYTAMSGYPGSMNNQLQWVADSWQSPDETGAVQQFTSGRNPLAVRAYTQYSTSNAAIVNTSFMRLRNLSVGYTIPRPLPDVMECYIYFQAQNLWTISSVEGMDPEQWTGFLPTLQQLTIGLKLNF